MIRLLTLLGGVLLLFGISYVVYGRYLANLFELDDGRTTPAHENRDELDYVPSRKSVLFGHHFSSIAGGAPIVGPITATLAWGWAPALVWIVVGTIVYGGLNDFAVLSSSMRHEGRSVGHVFERYVDERGKHLMLSIAVVSNLLVVGVLSLVVAVVFDSYPSTATASVIYVALAVLFGGYRRAGLPFGIGTVVFVSGMFGGVLVGLAHPLVLVPAGETTFLPTVVNPNVAAWLALVLVYACGASVLPVRTLLQPRDYLSSFLLYAGLGGAIVAIVVGTLFGTASEPLTMNLPPFKGFLSDEFGGIGPLVPMLFPTIFCGAVCGLHSMVCCGTTPKQLDRETDVKAIGYGTSLLEGVLAVIAIGTVAVVPSIPRGSGISLALPSFAEGGSIILSALGLPPRIGGPFMALVLSAFALTTVDTSIRLGRYFVEDLVGTQTTYVQAVATDRYFNSVAQTVLAFALVASGSWATIWPLFGASVQVFAGISILTVALWLVSWDHTKRRGIASLLVGGGFILVTSTTALLYLGLRSLREKLLNPSWLAAATTTRTLSVAIRILVVAVLVYLVAHLVRRTYRRVQTATPSSPAAEGTND